MKSMSRIAVPAMVVPLMAFLSLSCEIFDPEYRGLKNSIAAGFEGKTPVEWSETASGVITKLPVREKVIALTFDACGSSTDGYDKELIDYLVEQKIPATLFINARWIDRNRELFIKLAGTNLTPHDNEKSADVKPGGIVQTSDFLFEIENHGLNHKPCSINGKSIYNIRGTGSPSEVVDEIEKNGRKIAKLTGRKPRFYRSGTAYYDEFGVQIAGLLGYKVIGFDILGDAGTTYNAQQVEKAMLTCRPGSIVICHFNHPEKETYEGIIRALPELKKRGFRFVKLEDYL